MTVRELLARTDSRELAEWQAYAALEPFGEGRADLRAAEITWMMANLWRGKNQKVQPLQDFVLAAPGEAGADEDEMTPERMLAAAKAAFGTG